MGPPSLCDVVCGLDGIALLLRETEYKGLQLSLDQVSPKTPFPYSSIGGGGAPSALADHRRTPKGRAPRPKTKARLSPYTQVNPHLILEVMEACGLSIFSSKITTQPSEN